MHVQIRSSSASRTTKYRPLADFQGYPILSRLMNTDRFQVTLRNEEAPQGTPEALRLTMSREEAQALYARLGVALAGK